MYQSRSVKMNLFLMTLAILTLTATANDCRAGVSNCLNTFLKNVFEHDDSTDLVCQELKSYIGCIFAQNCRLTAEIRQTLFNIVQKQLKRNGITCPFSFSDVIDDQETAYTMSPRGNHAQRYHVYQSGGYGNGANRDKTLSSAVLSSVCFVLVALRRLFL